MYCAVIVPDAPANTQLADEAAYSVQFAAETDLGPFDDIFIIRVGIAANDLCGRAAAYSQAVRHAQESGIEWLFFLGEGDIVHPYAFQSVFVPVEEQDAIFGLLSEQDAVGPGGIRELPQVRNMSRLEDLLCNDPAQTLQWGHLLRTEVALMLGMAESIAGGEDLVYQLRLWSRYRCCKLEQTLCVRRAQTHEEPEGVNTIRSRHRQLLDSYAHLLAEDDGTVKYPGTEALFRQMQYLQQQGQTFLAEPLCQLVLQYDNRPSYCADAYYNLGNVLYAQGKLTEAVINYRHALTLKQDYAEASYNLGIALHAQGKLTEAVASYHNALTIKPDYAAAYNNLGVALKDQDKPDEAVASYHKALAYKPEYADAHNNLAVTLQDQGKLDEAVASYRKVLMLKPDSAAVYSNLLFCLSHNATIDAETLFAKHCHFGEQFETPFLVDRPKHTHARNPERALRIGFVSGDFCNHAMACFIEPLLAHLSRYPDLSLHAYCNNVIEDTVTQRISAHFAQWHVIAALSDAALTAKIRADGIDILIDLSGHTAGNRLLTFARKPAPVQASWMGYAGTTGLQAMDYYLTDRFFLPNEKLRAQFTEQIVYLPASAPFTPYKEAPSVNALPALGNGFVTFGSFNRLSKLSRPVIALWAELLRALPASRIVIGSMPQSESNPLADWFAEEGIVRERVDFHPKYNMQAYLTLHHQVDICLDTFPYNGGTTTSHALWMGVPTLTLSGNTPASRSGATLLSHARLEAFIAEDAEDFVRKGLMLANKVEELAQIRMGLRACFELSARGQPAQIAESLQRALRSMWQRWCEGLPPETIDVIDKK